MTAYSGIHDGITGTHISPKEFAPTILAACNGTWVKFIESRSAIVKACDMADPCQLSTAASLVGPRPRNLARPRCSGQYVHDHMEQCFSIGTVNFFHQPVVVGENCGTFPRRETTLGIRWISRPYKAGHFCRAE